MELNKKKIVRMTKNTKTILVLSIPEKKGDLYNSLILIKSGKIIERFFKKELPNYGVFDERRYFSTKDHSKNLFYYKNQKIKFFICEDMWGTENYQTKTESADLIISINASPYEIGKDKLRKNLAKKKSKLLNSKLIYLNLIGSQDDLIFDGGSFALNEKGENIHQFKYFEEDERVIDLLRTGMERVKIDDNQNLFNALKLSLASYVKRNNFNSIIIGLSGGIDSALCLAIAVNSLGAENVFPYFLPTKYSSEQSRIDSNVLCKNLGVKLTEFSIEDLRTNIEGSLTPFFDKKKKDSTEENLQSRIRGLILMALSNKTNSMLLATGNKSEYAVGYATLYGDMCGGFALLKDIYKTKVYELCNWINNNTFLYSDIPDEIIPKNIISKEPTAELKFNQKDTDNLPPYEVLDKILELLIDKNKGLQSIVKKGYDKELVKKVWLMIKNSEFKRYQSVVGPKITNMSLSNDRRFPLTNKFEL